MMEFELTLTEEDYLQFQLYTASQSPRIKKKRIKSLITVVLMFLVLSYLFWTTGNPFLMWWFLGTTLVSIIFYPIYLRRHYRNHYSKFIQENYKVKVGKKGYMKFTKDKIYGKDEAVETNINLSEIEKIVEIPSHFFVYLKTGIGFIFPKREFSDVEKLRDFLFKLGERLEVRFSSELDWKWK